MNKEGKTFVNFTPTISQKAASRIKKEIRSWKLHLRSDKDIGDLARMFNSIVQGWVNYYGRYYKSAMYPSLRNIEQYLTRCNEEIQKIPRTQAPSKKMVRLR